MSENLDLSVYLILDPPMCGGFDATLKVTQEACEAGVSIMQLRAPTWHKKAWYELALALKPICHKYSVPLIINDHIDVALAVDADGVHVGQSDLPISVVRSILGPEKIIGLSVSNLTETNDANDLAVDYLGIGPILSTKTKIDAAQVVGFDGAKQMVTRSRYPNVLIGGLNLEHIAQVKQTGSNGICVVSAICAAENPKEVVLTMKNEWELS